MLVTGLSTGATGASCNCCCLYRLTIGDGPSSYNASSSCTKATRASSSCTEDTGEATRVGGVAVAAATGEAAVDSARDGGVDGGSDSYRRHPFWPWCAGAALPRSPHPGEIACDAPPLSSWVQPAHGFGRRRLCPPLSRAAIQMLVCRPCMEKASSIAAPIDSVMQVAWLLSAMPVASLLLNHSSLPSG